MSKTNALLQWCQNQTHGYKGVELTNWTSSWRNGLAWCALIHKYKPDALDYAMLSPDSEMQNLELAFSIAERLGVPKLLDAEDMFPVPEKMSVITYTMGYYKLFETLRGAETPANDPAVPSPGISPTPLASPGAPSPVVAQRTPRETPQHRHGQNDAGSTTSLVAASAMGEVSGAIAAATATEPPAYAVPLVSPRSGARPRCDRCGRDIPGRSVEALGRTFHEHCFVCRSCGNRVSSQSFVAVDDQVYCQTHGRPMLLQRQRTPPPPMGAVPNPHRPSAAEPPKPCAAVSASPTTPPLLSASPGPMSPGTALLDARALSPIDQQMGHAAPLDPAAVAAEHQQARHMIVEEVDKAAGPARHGGVLIVESLSPSPSPSPSPKSDTLTSPRVPEPLKPVPGRVVIPIIRMPAGPAQPPPPQQQQQAGTQAPAKSEPEAVRQLRERVAELEAQAAVAREAQKKLEAQVELERARARKAGWDVWRLRAISTGLAVALAATAALHLSFVRNALF